jgi:hypothetical protein
MGRMRAVGAGARRGTGEAALATALGPAGHHPLLLFEFIESQLQAAKGVLEGRQTVALDGS